MLSGVRLSTLPELDFSNFDAFASAVECKMPPGPQRLQCLRGVSASTIHTYINGPNSGVFVPGVDKYVTFCFVFSEKIRFVMGSIV